MCTSNSDIKQLKVESWSKAAVERASRNAMNDNFSVMGMMGCDIKGSSCPGGCIGCWHAQRAAPAGSGNAHGPVHKGDKAQRCQR